MEITDNTPIVMLTVGQLKEVIRQEIEQSELKLKEEKSEEVVEYAYGLGGIRDMFNVSHATAQKYKNGILKDAVIQNGRKIIIDVKKARELFANSKQ
ncbi:DUF3853 family protein [Marinilabilia salmonicolor]|uniref:DUF3853 family protein n=1 Tax=Marinilabilia salmonicolor TaxID=989 RepID=UPI00029ADB59|nr:DUF3853 family protein [Marinilabilia salmonicolor]